MSKFLKLYEDTLANTQDGFSRGIASRDNRAQQVTVDDVVQNNATEKQNPNKVKVAKKLPYQLENLDKNVGDLYVNIQNLDAQFKSCLHSINIEDKEDVKDIVKILGRMFVDVNNIIKKIKKIVE